MMDNISPEEKLLRLIRGEKKTAALLQKKPRPLSIRETESPVKSSEYSLRQKYLSFFYIRKAITWVFVLSLIYLIFTFAYPWVGLRKIKLPEVKKTEAVIAKIGPSQDIKTYDYYLEAVKERQIFGNASVQENAGAISGVNLDLIKDINLVGIIFGENPQAIIEDKKTQKSYYVTKGQFIGEFQVEDIQEGKVIVVYRNQRFELYL